MWYMLRRNGQEIMTDSAVRLAELQNEGFKLMQVVDINDVSKCKEEKE